MLRKGCQIVHVVWHRLFRDRRFHQALGDKVRIPAIWGSGMRVVPDCKTEVSLGARSWQFCSVFTGPQELDDREGQVGERHRISGLRAGQKVLECLRIGSLGKLGSMLSGYFDDAVPALWRVHDAAD